MSRVCLSEIVNGGYVAIDVEPATGVPAVQRPPAFKVEPKDMELNGVTVSFRRSNAVKRGVKVTETSTVVVPDSAIAFAQKEVALMTCVIAARREAVKVTTKKPFT